MKTLKYSFVVLLCVNIAACSGSDAEAVRSAFDQPQTKATALQLSGKWTSDCIDSAFGPDYGRRIISLKLSGNNFELQTDDYYGTDCSALLETSIRKGTYSSIKSYDSNTHLLEYRIPINEQVSSLLNQKIQINDNTLLTSEVLPSETDTEKATLTIIMKKVEE